MDERKDFWQTEFLVKSVLCWLFVIIPLGWGVTQSVKKSVPLFRPNSPGVVEPLTGKANPAKRGGDTPRAGSAR